MCIAAGLSFGVTSCAIPGSPTGGPKDTIPPKILEMKPKNMSTHFNDDEINIYFDEYIKLVGTKKNLVISPPLKEDPDIKPKGLPRTSISILFNEKLKKKTTYTFNFGESIVDNNEGNKLPNFKYIFSTGAYIDSLYTMGKVAFCDSDKIAKNTLVMLYKVDAEYTDSIVYKDKPTYFSNTLDSNLFKINHIKKGKYRIVALKNPNNKFKYNPRKDQIAFYKNDIILPQDTSTIIKLRLFKEADKFRIKSPIHKAKGRILLNFEGQNKNITAHRIAPVKHDTLKDLFIYSTTGDTIKYWFERGKEKFIKFLIKEENKIIDTLKVKLKKQKQEKFNVNVLQTTLKPKEYITIQTNKPIVKIDTAFVQVLDKDSLKVKYTTRIDTFKQKIQFIFKNQPDQKYNITLLPKAITNILRETNDTLISKVSTRKLNEYGLIELKINNVKAYPIIVQLLQGNKIVAKRYATKKQSFIFKHLLPGKYSFKIIFDKNKNKKWDTGNYLKRILPEETLYYKERVEVKANWDIEQSWNL